MSFTQKGKTWNL